MNKEQGNHYRMHLGTQEYLDVNSTVWNAIPKAVVYKNDLDEIIARIQSKSEIVHSGISVKERKDKLKKFIALKLSALSGTIQAYAHEIDDMDLYNKVKVSKSSLEKMKEEEIDGYVKSITNLAQKYIQSLADFGVSEASITEILTSVDEFNTLIGKPLSILNTKYMAIETVDQLIDEGSKLLKNKMDNIMLIFRDTNPEFYSGYLRARTIIDR